MAESMFTPSEEKAIELVAAANRRANDLAARIVEIRKYALAKGDRTLLAMAERAPHSS